MASREVKEKAEARNRERRVAFWIREGDILGLDVDWIDDMMPLDFDGLARLGLRRWL
jgi:hypothetical protein